MFTVLSPLIGGGGSWALDVSLQHDANPLTAGGGDMGGAGLIERRDSLVLGFAYALSRKLELGLSLPIHSQSGCGSQASCLMQGGVRGPVGPSGMTMPED